MITYKPENILLRKSNRQRTIDFGGSAPEPPGFIALFSKGANKRRRQKASPLCKSETALGSRPRVALSSVPAKQLYFNIQLFQLSSSFSQIVLDIGYTLQTDNNYIKNIYTECNQSTDPALAEILQNCELKSFESKTAQMLESAVRVLYYKQSIKLSGAVLPQTEIRNLLRKVNRDTLIDAVEVLRHNENEVQNPQGYLYSVILNAVNAEHTSTLLELPDNMIDREMLYASD